MTRRCLVSLLAVLCGACAGGTTLPFGPMSEGDASSSNTGALIHSDAGSAVLDEPSTLDAGTGHPSESATECVQDGQCNSNCANDPDCSYEAGSEDTSETSSGLSPCYADGQCNPICADVDPDCSSGSSSGTRTSADYYCLGDLACAYGDYGDSSAYDDYDDDYAYCEAYPEECL